MEKRKKKGERSDRPRQIKKRSTRAANKIVTEGIQRMGFILPSKPKP